MLRSDRLASVAAALALAALPLAACSAPEPPPAPDPTEIARGIHERVIAIDTHDDINAANFTTVVVPPIPVWVLSAGPNGVVETNIAAATTVTGGDDIGFRVR